ncbi:MAG: hypothetical protein Q7U73_10965 [Rubrivivax sp.]|nr:hypothetical protein [Rubrivivax sp.]
MKLANPIPGPGLLSRTLRVGASQVLDLPVAAQPGAVSGLGSIPTATPMGLPLGTQLSVSWRLKLPHPLATPPAQSTKPSPTPITLAHVTKNVGIGLGLGGTTMTLMPLAQAATTAELSTRLTQYGFAPATSEVIAQQGLDFARSHAGQLTTLFVAGTAVGVGVVEAVRPDWSWTRKILTGSLLGLALLGLAGWGHHMGWWGQDAAQKTSPPASPHAVIKNPASPP